LKDLLNTSSPFISGIARLSASNSYHTAMPFKHLILDDFFAEEVASAIAKDFPSEDHVAWKRYLNPLENKFLTNSWDAFSPLTYRVFSELNSPNFVQKLELLTGVFGLSSDDGLHGGGLHMHGRGGSLNLHLDYSIHPKLNLQRRLNLLVYLTPNWQQEWGGELELWAGNKLKPTTVCHKIVPKFNRAIIFDTTTNSWHGLPEPIRCPESIFRKSIALYYLSQPDSSEDKDRKKAKFVPRPDQANDPEIKKLILMRSDTENAYKTYER
jgi:Rps23 Pro-64 3,4-dihydroxylase Tpa1-like proline 4-hydroxylase